MINTANMTRGYGFKLSSGLPRVTLEKLESEEGNPYERGERVSTSDREAKKRRWSNFRHTQRHTDVHPNKAEKAKTEEEKQVKKVKGTDQCG